MSQIHWYFYCYWQDTRSFCWKITPTFSSKSGIIPSIAFKTESNSILYTSMQYVVCSIWKYPTIWDSSSSALGTRMVMQGDSEAKRMRMRKSEGVNTKGISCLYPWHIQPEREDWVKPGWSSLFSKKVLKVLGGGNSEYFMIITLRSYKNCQH